MSKHTHIYIFIIYTQGQPHALEDRRMLGVDRPGHCWDADGIPADQLFGTILHTHIYIYIYLHISYYITSNHIMSYHIIAYNVIFPCVLFLFVKKNLWIS